MTCWLQTPDAVLDQSSPAYNGGHTELHLSSVSTVDAFAEQAREDLTSFLAARALEMAKGGCMLLVFGLREGYYPYKVRATIELQERIWNDLVSEVIIVPKCSSHFDLYLFVILIGVHEFSRRHGLDNKNMV
ncbi:hypothetical protein R1flu_014860 [Riccia fluitans]|uniref:Uncharacterized protein n=1 Tax=Riccia fluitans TaxID=41844 RepID=A0ABD1YKN5_9MARC